MQRPDRFDEKLARIFNATGAKGDTALANILGIKPPSVAAARKRRQIPTGWVEDIAEKYNISADWLFFGRGPQCHTHSTSPALTATAPVASLPIAASPLASSTLASSALMSGHPCPPLAPTLGTAPCTAPRTATEIVLIPHVIPRLVTGTSTLQSDDSGHKAHAFGAEWLALKGHASHMVLMIVIGDAMQPEIKHSDMVLIDQSKTSILSYGYFAVGMEDTVFVKQLRVRPGKLVLHSLNKDYEEIEIDMKGEQPTDVRILGRVVWCGREYV